ncbi:hypothetical protein EV421DRAFT_1903961 [Armillaria borealis]|uniref:Uncharacterized protein n=1 Tax=Armillaria borealis TaxID=47425 RepID=A0AA39JHS9_9AGAR|nr:hypothetical protein EV421DRAFT_1903961 [Armillaria borealis]
MSPARIPSRGQCIQPIDNNLDGCQCSWFASTLLDQYICGACGHGIHAHVDYVSMIVNHYPATQCAAYVQKTPLTQCCTCGTWLYDHIAINNLYRSAEPWNVLDHFPDNDDLSSNAIGFSNDDINDAYTPSSVFSSSTDSNTTDLAPALISSLSISPHAFGSSGDATENILHPLTPLSSPSASSAPSTTQSHTTQTQGYSSDDYFIQYPDHLINSSYARQPGGVTDESFEYQYYSANVMHGAPEAWSGQYD